LSQPQRPASRQDDNPDDHRDPLAIEKGHELPDGAETYAPVQPIESDHQEGYAEVVNGMPLRAHAFRAKADDCIFAETAAPRVRGFSGQHISGRSGRTLPVDLRFWAGEHRDR